MYILRKLEKSTMFGYNGASTCHPILKPTYILIFQFFLIGNCKMAWTVLPILHKPKKQFTMYEKLLNIFANISLTVQRTWIKVCPKLFGSIKWTRWLNMPWMI